MKQRKIEAKLSLVGAGPGDPELITLKAIRTLATADVVLYDALVNPSLLDYAPKSAKKVFVGKRVGKHSFPQKEINRLIIANALTEGHVVRLKGGDPFVFGRGHEEIEYTESFGIKTQVIPGISSAIAVPATQQIPLTRRGISQSFWVITGTTKTGELSNDVALAAQSTATVVILMGTKKLGEITQIFKAQGKAETAVAIIQNGTLENEKVGLGTVSTIEEVVQEKQLAAPAIIVIGDVVRSHANFETELVPVLRNQF